MPRSGLPTPILLTMLALGLLAHSVPMTAACCYAKQESKQRIVEVKVGAVSCCSSQAPDGGCDTDPQDEDCDRAPGMCDCPRCSCATGTLVMQWSMPTQVRILPRTAGVVDMTACLVPQTSASGLLRPPQA